MCGFFCGVLSMDTFTILAVLITLTAILTYFNHRWLKINPTIGVMVAGLSVAVFLVFLGVFDPDIPIKSTNWISNLNFQHLLLDGMLGFLLFAGSLQVDMRMLLRRKWQVGIYALVGVVGSAFLIALMLHPVSKMIGLNLAFMDCLLFGALISPTDPIAVLAILRKVGAPKDLETDITGESLFNDGIGVVMFLIVAKLMIGSDVGVATGIWLFGIEALGGIGIGLVLGLLCSRIIRSAEETSIQILITLAVASAGYFGAQKLHTSGPLAMVVSGIIIGNHENWLTRHSRIALDSFWDIIDKVGNAVLFMLVGLEVLVIAREALPELSKCILAGAVAVPIVLLGRAISLYPPVRLLGMITPTHKHTVRILTWGGLRGGLPLAMALCIPTAAQQISKMNRPQGEITDRAMLMMMTYFVVIFSIVVQGLTIKKVISRGLEKEAKTIKRK
jgi:monovalent cation:H+ antiporter, CPA1 family